MIAAELPLIRPDVFHLGRALEELALREENKGRMIHGQLAGMERRHTEIAS